MPKRKQEYVSLPVPKPSNKCQNERKEKKIPKPDPWDPQTIFEKW